MLLLLLLLLFFAGAQGRLCEIVDDFILRVERDNY